MNKLLILTLGVTLAGLLPAKEATNAATTAGKRPELTMEQRKMQLLRHHGGFVVQPGKGKGSVAIVNASGELDDVFADMAANVQKYLRIKAVAKRAKGKVTLSNADQAFAETGDNAAVFGVSEDRLPALLVAPEQKWGFVNVKALKKDNPAEDVLKKRLMKELWRAFALTCGAGDTRTKECVLNPVLSLKDLDAFNNDMISMERLNEMNEHFKLLGIEPFRRTSYRRACQEGWAPAPTNDFQKAIWEKFHSEKERGPVNGLKIPMPK